MESVKSLYFLSPGGAELLRHAVEMVFTFICIGILNACFRFERRVPRRHPADVVSLEAAQRRKTLPR